MDYFFAHEMGLCAYVGEAEPGELKKWLGWYRRRGVSCFYLYGEGDTSALRKLLQNDILAGTVVVIGLTLLQERDRNLTAYEDCMKRVRYICRHLICVQPGEYLQGLGEESLPGLLGRCFGEDTASLQIESVDGKPRYVINPLYVHGVDENCKLLWTAGYKLRSVGGLSFDRKRPKRIALLSHVMARNGAPMALLSAAKVLKSVGYELDVYGASQGAMEEEFRALGIPVIVDPSLHGIPLVDEPWYCEYDLIVANTAIFIGSLVKELKDTPVLWWLHESKSILSACRVSPEFADKIQDGKLYTFGVSQVANEDFHTIAPSVPLFGTLPLGVADNFRGKRKRTSEKFRFIMCGSWEERKGQDVFLQAIGLLTEEERSCCEFYLVGSKSSNIGNGYEDKIISLAAGRAEVRLLKNMPHEKIIALYEEMDAVVVPSREESLSIVAIEAMMMGLPCILSDHVGVASELENGKEGLLFPSGESEKLAEKMRYLLKNPQVAMKMGQEGRMLYEEKFSEKRFADNILKTVDGIIERIIKPRDKNKKIADEHEGVLGINHKFLKGEIIDIIVPIYNALDELKKCLESVYKNTTYPYNLYLIDDKSTDVEIGKYLELLERKSKSIYLKELHILRNEQNVGFVKTVNKAISLSDNDIIILNTDTEVPMGWLERFIEAAKKDERIASITPFSNSATICSFPEILKDNDMYMNKSLEEIFCTNRYPYSCWLLYVYAKESY